MPNPPLSKLEVWKMAARPKTLPAAAAPVLVGAAIAFYENSLHWLPVLAALMGALLLQIGANLANDYFDYFKGADAGERLGPVRVTQAGLAAPAEVRLAMSFVFGLATLIGLYLAWAGGWPIIVVGLLSIVAAIAYTGGPYPLGYHGLGDVFAFAFFGPVAVCGTVYVQSKTVSPLAAWASVPIGLLVVAILVVNNLRDIESDRRVGKRTLAVRWGERGAQIEYALMLAGAYLSPWVMFLMGVGSLWTLLSWLSLALTPALLRLIFTQKGRPLNRALAGTGQLTLAYGALFALGLVIARLLA